jgi:hypothetical protein
MTSLTFWLALACITIFGLLWIRFCGWVVTVLMECLEGESKERPR